MVISVKRMAFENNCPHVGTSANRLGEFGATHSKPWPLFWDLGKFAHRLVGFGNEFMGFAG